MDLVAYLERLWAWTQTTHGPGRRTRGIVEHIREELEEVLANPLDVVEWCDVAMLALNGAMRAGFTADQVAEALQAKQDEIFARKYPDWRLFTEDQKINHDRTVESL